MDVKMKRDIVLLGHAHCGKTTLTESLLFVTGTTTRKGDVMAGTTVSDFYEDEIERKISINASFARIQYKDHQIQLIDTPGYMDFIGETVSAMHVADGAVMVIDAVNGVEVGTEDSWERLEALQLPRAIFINKTDKPEAKVAEVITAIHEQLSSKAIVIDMTNSEFVEAVAECDDQLLEKYLESGSLSPEEVRVAFRKAVIQAKVFPIISGSALKDTNVKELLDLIIEYFPSPLERSAFPAKDPEAGEEKPISPTIDDPFAGLVFKSMFDPHLGQLSLVRVLRGKFSSGSAIYNVTSNSRENINTFNILQGKEQIAVSEASCGDIIALPKLKNTRSGDTLCADKEKTIVTPIVYPEPSISASIKPKSRADEEKISTSLQRMCEEDHTIKINRDNETKEMIISGIGDLHLKVIVERMKRRYNLDVELGTPKVSYREAITKTARARYKHKKQSGGRGQYGDVEIEVSPLPREGMEYEFVNKIFGGAIPKNFVPSAEKGIKQAISEGVIAGYPVIHIQVKLVDGSYHDVDSSDMAFQIAGLFALKDAVKQAGPVLLEPIMDVSIVIPDEFIGPISGDISGRRGKIMGSEAKGKNQLTKALIPLAEMFTYANDLRSMTGGRGNYSMKFAHFETVPAKITQQIIAQRQQQQQQHQS
jgi:elongation factor G